MGTLREHPGVTLLHRCGFALLIAGSPLGAQGIPYVVQDVVPGVFAIIRRPSPASGSDSNVLVVVDELSLVTLRAAADLTMEWMSDGNPPPMIFTQREWRSSADIFPMEYSDILERHRVLFGEDVFAGISVSPEHLRLQIEQEAMGKLLHLRQSVFGASTDTRAQTAYSSSKRWLM